MATASSSSVTFSSYASSRALSCASSSLTREVVAFNLSVRACRLDSRALRFCEEANQPSSQAAKHMSTQASNQGNQGSKRWDIWCAAGALV
jgi:hypothetical protein